MRQFLAVTMQKSKLQSCSQTLQMLKGRQQCPAAPLQAVLPAMPEQSSPSAISPALDGLGDPRDPFQPELLLPHCRAANLLCLHLSNMHWEPSETLSFSPSPSCELFLQDEQHHSCLGKPQHHLFFIFTTCAEFLSVHRTLN